MNQRNLFPLLMMLMAQGEIQRGPRTSLIDPQALLVLDREPEDADSAKTLEKDLIETKLG